MVILWFFCSESIRCYPIISFLPLSHTDTSIIADLGAVGALSWPAHILEVVRISVTYLLSMALYCCFSVETEKLSCFYHLPRILHTFNFNTGSIMWITYVTITTVVTFFSDNLVVNVPLHILLFHARMIHLLFKAKPYQLNLCFINAFNIFCIHLTNLPSFNSTSTQE